MKRILRNVHSCAHSEPPAPEQLLELILQSLDDDKAIDIVDIDLAGKSTIADAMVVASGASVRQVGAMAEHLRERLKATGVKGFPSKASRTAIGS